jgi:hypothetical protein
MLHAWTRYGEAGWDREGGADGARGSEEEASNALGDGAVTR